METEEIQIPVQTDEWEIKDRNYYLLHGRSPLTYTLTSKHTRRYPLLYFDKNKEKKVWL